MLLTDKNTTGATQTMATSIHNHNDVAHIDGHMREGIDVTFSFVLKYLEQQSCGAIALKLDQSTWLCAKIKEQIDNSDVCILNTELQLAAI